MNREVAHDPQRKVLESDVQNRRSKWNQNEDVIPLWKICFSRSSVRQISALVFRPDEDGGERQ